MMTGETEESTRREIVIATVLVLAVIAVVLTLLCALVGCSKESTDLILPSPQPPESLVCKDAAGFGPDITLTAPPSVRHQLKMLDGCFQHGQCFYNCGKKP